MSLTLSIVALFVAIGVGAWAYLNHSGGAGAWYDGFATVSSAFWVLSGTFLILGGFQIVGMIVVALFLYVFLSKGAKTQKRLRAKIAN
ncbi:hypothetical protein [Halorubellus salinus]|uniref:hypothetical protein n=1 Tax=Halorubellus salinus TaxID=755309 RepID=UPI001D06A37E|nr:hypothetical protein [Halorubellus salinus]